RMDDELGRVQCREARTPQSNQELVVLATLELRREAADDLQRRAANRQVRGQQTARVAGAREETRVAIVEDRERRPMLTVQPHWNGRAPARKDFSANGCSVRILV